MTGTGKMKQIFTLRGHNEGVTSLAHCHCHLISGDEVGTLIVWDLTTFKQLAKFENFSKSTIQSIKGVSLNLGHGQTNVLVVQSRNDGVQVLDLYEPNNGNIKSVPNILASFPTYDSLFSRGDAKSLGDGRAILAYPSLLESYLVTIRVLGRDAKTEVSGTAGNDKHITKRFPVFDIVVKRIDREGGYHLFVAHEDGCINIHEFRLSVTQTVPVLNSEGLNVRLIEKIDFNFKDFVSAYDVRTADNRKNYLMVAGSPTKDLCFINCSVMSNCKQDAIHRIRLKSSGVSAISVRPDARLVAVACWDKSVRLYSMDQEHEMLATLNQHSKQVQAILFVPKPTPFLMDLSSLSAATSDDEGHFLVCCASQDGTISISSQVY